MSVISRGFRGRRAADVDRARVPPGQYVTKDFPVLSAGPTPHTSLELWDFSIIGELEEPRTPGTSENSRAPSGHPEGTRGVSRSRDRQVRGWAPRDSNPEPTD